jgi:Zn-dependent protease with chaperone function
MKRTRTGWSPLPILLVLCSFCLSLQICQSEETNRTVLAERILRNGLKGKTFTLRAQPNPAARLYLVSGANTYVARLEQSALFRLPADLANVKVTSVESTVTDGDVRPRFYSGAAAAAMEQSRMQANVEYFKISIRHESLGRGTVSITTEAGKLPVEIEDVFKLLGFVLQGEPLPDSQRYFQTTNSGMVHYAACGHGDPNGSKRTFTTLQEAVSADLNPCPLCFSDRSRLPMIGMELEIGKQTEAQVRHLSRIHDSPSMTALVNRLGSQVLSNWPAKLKGYNYRFSVLDESDINAVACPGGYIFVNRGLLEACESEDELEAALAHEIAHVEQRHALSELLKARRNARNAAIFAAVIGVGIGAGAVAAGSEDAAQITLAGSQIGLVLASIAYQISVQGYSKQHEQEADIYALIYLEGRKKTKQPLVSILKKLRSCEDIAEGLTGRRLVSDSHPKLTERLCAAQTMEVKVFTPNASFDAFEKDGDLLYNLTLNAQAIFEKRPGEKTILVLGEVSTTPAIGESESFNQMRISFGKKTRAFEADGEVSIGAMETMAVSFSKGGNDEGFIQGEFTPNLKGISSAKVVRRE